MKQRRRRGITVATALALAVPLAAGVVPWASARAQDRYAGSCVLTLSADQTADGSSMAVTTTSNGLCLVNGEPAEIDLSGNLEPTVSGRPFSCGDKIGDGSVQLSFWDDPESTDPPLVVGNATFRAVDVFGAVSGSSVKETAEQHLAGTFHGDRSPIVTACEDEDAAVAWTVVYNFEMNV